jgi:hypothetical protein
MRVCGEMQVDRLRRRQTRLSELGWRVKASCVSVLVGVECVCVSRPPVMDDPAEGGRMMVSVGSVDALSYLGPRLPWLGGR